MADADSIQALLQDTAGHAEYKYPTGELTIVNIVLADLGTKRIRVANLTPETSNDNLKAALAPYGKIMNIQNERWSRIYRYPVDNGVRQVTMVLSRHAPSRLTVAGQQVLLSYEGQPPTCYGCGESGHMYQGCPKRRKMTSTRIAAKAATYAAIVMENDAMEGNPPPEMVTGNNTVEDEVPAPSTIVDRSATSSEVAIAGEQMEPPDHTNILAQPDTLAGIDDGTDNSQGKAEVEHGQRKEVSEPQGDSPTNHDGESRAYIIKHNGHKTARHQEEAVESYEGVDVVMVDKEDPPPHKERDRTPEELRRSPKRKKCEI